MSTSSRLPSLPRGLTSLPPSRPLAEVAVRMLLCTAQDLANTPGGLRFVADSRPWLQGLPVGRDGKSRPVSPDGLSESAA